MCVCVCFKFLSGFGAGKVGIEVTERSGKRDGDRALDHHKDADEKTTSETDDQKQDNKQSHDAARRAHRGLRVNDYLDESLGSVRNFLQASLINHYCGLL